jgi:tRNA threonylcarbamoyladenosine biosynthesis protein TsaB
LGISSATKILSIALVKDAELLAEFNVAGDSAQAEKITLWVEAAFNQARLDIKKINAIAVVTGPGAYGGVRGGVTSAKSFAQVRRIPLFGVSTLEVMAANFKNSNQTIVVVLDARRDEFNLAMFAATAAGLKRLTADFVISSARLVKKLNKISGEILVAGAIDKIPDLAKLKTKENLTFVSFAQSFPRASLAAWLAQARASVAGERAFLKLLPKYSHQPNLKKYTR